MLIYTNITLLRDTPHTSISAIAKKLALLGCGREMPFRHWRKWRWKGSAPLVFPASTVHGSTCFLTSRFTARYSARQRAPFSGPVFLNAESLIARDAPGLPCMWQNCCEGIMIRGPHKCLAPANLCTRRQPAVQQPPCQEIWILYLSRKRT